MPIGGSNYQECNLIASQTTAFKTRRWLIEFWDYCVK